LMKNPLCVHNTRTLWRTWQTTARYRKLDKSGGNLVEDKVSKSQPPSLKPGSNCTLLLHAMVSIVRSLALLPRVRSHAIAPQFLDVLLYFPLQGTWSWLEASPGTPGTGVKLGSEKLCTSASPARMPDFRLLNTAVGQ